MYEDYEDLSELKQEDSYHYSVPFEYITSHNEDGTENVAETNMEVDVTWSDEEEGYKISYDVPEMDLIDPSEGNSDEEGFYKSYVEGIVLDELENEDIGPSALVGGTGTY